VGDREVRKRKKGAEKRWLEESLTFCSYMACLLVRRNKELSLPHPPANTHKQCTQTVHTNSAHEQYTVS
jgi:hypothetical protein